MKEAIGYILGNVRKGPVTTLVGIVIILASIASVFYLPDVGWAEATVGLVVGSLLAFSKDPKKPPTGGLSLLVGGLLLVALSGCYTRQACLDKVCPKTSSQTVDSTHTTTTIEYRDSIITLPGDTARYFYNEPCDSTGVLKAFEASIMGNLNNAIAHIRSRNNRLEVECLCTEQKQEVRRLTTEIKELKERRQTSTEVRTITERYIPWYANWKFIAGLAVASWCAGYFRLHRYAAKAITKV